MGLLITADNVLRFVHQYSKNILTMCPNMLFQSIQDILQSFRCSLNVTQTNQLFSKCSHWAHCRNIFGIPVNKSQNIIRCYEQPHMDNMLILHSRCDQNVLSKNSPSTVNRSSQCSLNVITGFQVPLPPVLPTLGARGHLPSGYIVSLL